MEFLDLVKIRQSVREYSEKPVPRDKISRCLEAARLAPSACNDQPWKYIVIDEPELKNEIAKNTFGTLAGVSINRFTLQAPVLILLISDKPDLKKRFKGMSDFKVYHFLTDIGITAAYFCLQAAEEGLGTCTLGCYDEPKLKQLLKIPDSKQIDLIITLGYPKSNEIRPKVRKGMNQMANYNQYK